MKNKLLLTSLLITSSLFAQNGAMIFENKCMVCHILKMEWQLREREKSALIAPTAYGITKHVRDVFPNEKQFVEFVADYITKPAKIKSRCKEDVMKRFGLMPPIGIGMREEDKEAVASWMFNNIGVTK